MCIFVVALAACQAKSGVPLWSPRATLERGQTWTFSLYILGITYLNSFNNFQTSYNNSKPSRNLRMFHQLNKTSFQTSWTFLISWIQNFLIWFITLFRLHDNFTYLRSTCKALVRVIDFWSVTCLSLSTNSLN